MKLCDFMKSCDNCPRYGEDCSGEERDLSLIDAVNVAYADGRASASAEYENLIEKQEKEINELKDRIVELEKEPDNRLRFKYACAMKEIKFLEQQLKDKDHEQ